MDGQNDRNGQNSPQSQTDSCRKVRDAETSGKPPDSVCRARSTSTGRSLGSTRTHLSVCEGDSKLGSSRRQRPQ